MAPRLYTAKVKEVLGDCDDETASTDIDVQVIISYINVSSTILSKNRDAGMVIPRPRARHRPGFDYVCLRANPLFAVETQ